MRIYSFLLFIALFASLIFAQSGHDFLSRAPGLPNDACNMKREEIAIYKKSVNDLLIEMESLKSERSRKIENNVNKSDAQIEKDIARDNNLSDEDVQKLKNDNMSEDEKKALADKVIQQKTGISMQEVEKLKKMSKEGKKKWAEGYATQQMANMQGNGDSTKTEEQIKAEQEQIKNKNMFDLLQKQKLITDRIAASNNKFNNKMAELNQKDSVATIELDKYRKPLMERLSKGPSDEEAHSIRVKITGYEKTYCNKLTPIYFGILSDNLADLNKLMPEYDSLEVVTGEIYKSQLKIDNSFLSPGLFQLEAVMEYLSKLLSTFTYANYTFPYEAETTATE